MSRPSKPTVAPGCAARWLCGGWLVEHRHGYRFSPELELLPAFLGAGEPAGRTVELGSGNGALLLAALHGAPPGPPAIGLERQAQLVPLARANALARPLARAVRFCRADVRQPPLRTQCADRVLLNPPFYATGWGRESTRPERQASTHELHGGLPAFVAAAARLLRPGGHATLVYSPDRLAHLLLCLAAAGLAPTRLRLIRHQPSGALRRLFLDAILSPAGGPQSVGGLHTDEVELDYAAARGGQATARPGKSQRRPADDHR